MSRKTSELTEVTSLPVGAYIRIVDPSEPVDEDKNKRWTPEQAAVADVDVASLPAAGAFSAISIPGDGTISDPPTQAEVEQLRDALASALQLCDDLRTVIANQTTAIETLRDRLKKTGGCGLLADS